MKWSYIIYLPALVSIAWAMIIILTKKHLTHAQILFSLSLLVHAFSITVAGIYFRGLTNNLYIYSYLLEVSAMLYAPMFYISICSLTEPSGATLKQRRVFLVPILFTIGLTIGAFGMHPSRYQDICIQTFESGRVPWQPGDIAYNFMILWNQFVFPIAGLITGFTLVFFGWRKVSIYKKRFDSYYAERLNEPHIDIREFLILTCLFIPFGLFAIYLIAIRPYYYKYWIIGCALILTSIQYLTGRFAYRYDYDARFLANHIRNQNK